LKQINQNKNIAGAKSDFIKSTIPSRIIARMTLKNRSQLLKIAILQFNKINYCLDFTNKNVQHWHHIKQCCHRKYQLFYNKKNPIKTTIN